MWTVGGTYQNDQCFTLHILSQGGVKVEGRMGVVGGWPCVTSRGMSNSIRLSPRVTRWYYETGHAAGSWLACWLCNKMHGHVWHTRIVFSKAALIVSFFHSSIFHHLACLAVAITRNAGIGSLPWPSIVDVIPRISCSLCFYWIDRTTSLWSSSSWSDKVGRDTGEFLFSFNVWPGVVQMWDTEETTYNSDYCCNIKLLNTYFNKNVSLTA